MSTSNAFSMHLATSITIETLTPFQKSEPKNQKAFVQEISKNLFLDTSYCLLYNNGFLFFLVAIGLLKFIGVFH